MTPYRYDVYLPPEIAAPVDSNRIACATTVQVTLSTEYPGAFVFGAIY